MRVIPEPPTPGQIRLARMTYGLTVDAASAVVYRTASAWTQYENGVRPMDPALWELFRIKTTMIPLPDPPTPDKKPLQLMT